MVITGLACDAARDLASDGAIQVSGEITQGSLIVAAS